MYPFINLVSTVCVNEQRIALFSWYADHVQLLLQSAQLKAAQLDSCVQVVQGQAPDYLCAYEFANGSAFDQFEQGAEKAQATLLTNAAPGRNSVEIVRRQQFVRVLHRRYGSPQTPPVQSLWIELQASSMADLPTIRWLGAALQAASSAIPLHSAQFLAGISAPNVGMVQLRLGACDAIEVYAQVRSALEQHGAFAPAPAQWRIQWAALCQPVMHWLR